MIINPIFDEEIINTPAVKIRGRVEFYNGSTPFLICGCSDYLRDFKIERLGEKNKFFGFGICQKLTVNLLDKDRVINIVKGNVVEIEFGKDNEFIYTYPKFYVDTVNRDENTNDLTIVAYDALNNASKHHTDELVIYRGGYTLKDFAAACAQILGLPLGKLDDSFNAYIETANFEGTETIREALNAIAEATQTIYYIDWNWNLVFKKLDIDGAPVLTIDKSKYFTLKSSDARKLQTVCHATELGDNVSASLPEGNSTQYVRNNPLWELRNDIGEVVEAALANIGGLTITPFDCSWTGNILLEIGDKIALETKDNNIIYSYTINDVLNYDGAISQKTDWSYGDNETETASNPSSLGETIKQTYAKVDKANKRIDLVVSETENNSSNISQLTMTTNGIITSVSTLAQNNQETNTKIEQMFDNIQITINNIENRDIEEVTTTTGYKFNADGLEVSKSGSEMKTSITDDGMTVYKDNNEVLIANNKGVKAIDLHARTFLIIGAHSRLEDYEGSRTACFWIGGIN